MVSGSNLPSPAIAACHGRSARARAARRPKRGRGEGSPPSRAGLLLGKRIIRIELRLRPRSHAGSVRGWQGRFERAHFRRHQALRTAAEADEQAIARLQFGDPVTAQRLHMDENVLGAFAARQEAEAAHPVEPFDDADLIAARRRDLDMGAGRLQLGRMDRSRFVHRNDPEDLQALGARHRLANDARAFMGCLKSIPAQRRHMQQDIGQAVIGNDEPITFGDIEPLDPTCDLDQLKICCPGLLCAGSKIDAPLALRRLKLVGAQRTSSPELVNYAQADYLRYESQSPNRFDTLLVTIAFADPHKRRNLREAVDDCARRLAASAPLLLLEIDSQALSIRVPECIASEISRNGYRARGLTRRITEALA